MTGILCGIPITVFVMPKQAGIQFSQQEYRIARLRGR
jgi:hypothetical protein